MTTYAFAPASYHGGSLVTQRSDMTVGVLERAGVAKATCVLDVGCGAGQTLRIVEELNQAAVLVGIDPDEDAWRRGPRGTRIHFVKGAGERLPLADGSVSHAICRVAINYMHQASTLREVARVLAPGGKLVLSFIGFGYTLREALYPGGRGLRQRLGNIKDLLAGALLQVFGYQGSRHTFWGRSVPYTAVARLRRQVRERGCEILWLGCEGRFLGWATIWWAIVSKQGK